MFKLFINMISIILLCVLLCVVVIGVWYERVQEAKKPALPPKLPGGLPLIGHAYNFLANPIDLHEYLKYMASFCLSGGGVTYGIFGRDIYYAIGDPDDMITVANTCLQKHFMYKYAEPWLGNGLILVSGAEHKRHRKYMNPAFSTPMLNGFLSVFNSEYRKFIMELDQHVGKGFFDHYLMLRRQSLKIACLTTFGNEEKDEQFLNKYVDTVDSIMDIFLQKMVRIYNHIDIIYRLSGLKKKEQNLCADLTKISYEKLYKKRAAMKNGISYDSSAPCKSVLDVLLESSAEGGLSDSDIKDELNTTVAAAYETTSQQLLIATVFIGTYPEVQERMFKEIMEVLGPDRDVTKEDLSKLTYTEAVIKESLRMVPTAGMIARSVDQDVKLKNYTLRAGSHVLILPYALHFHPTWGSDVNEFNPERWLNKATSSTYANLFAPFSVGKRACIGRIYAMMSMKTVLVYMIRKFRLKADFSKVVLMVDPTTRSASGHDISLERRS